MTASAPRTRPCRRRRCISTPASAGWASPATRRQRLMADPAWFDALKPALLMSHLACSDDLASPMNARQLQRFTEVCGRLALPVNTPRSRGGLRRHLPGHALSSGFGPRRAPRSMAWRRSTTSRTRCAKSFACKRKSCKSGALTMATALATVRPTDSPGLPVWPRSASAMRMGIMRALSNRGAVHVGGGRSAHRRARLHGSDCHRCERTARKSAAQAGRCRRPDRPAADRVDELGERAGTIGYEILTSLGRRYRRTYIDARAAGVTIPVLQPHRPRRSSPASQTMGRLTLFTRAAPSTLPSSRPSTGA